MDFSGNINQADTLNCYSVRSANPSCITYKMHETKSEKPLFCLFFSKHQEHSTLEGVVSVCNTNKLYSLLLFLFFDIQEPNFIAPKTHCMIQMACGPVSA